MTEETIKADNDSAELNLEQYLKLFPKNKREKALDIAWKTRNFEIELYWKRTAYYWTLNAAIITGFTVLFQSTNNENNFKIILITYAVACLGFVFSWSWYFTNKASKFWQINSEKHIVALEDDITGPIYKTTIDFEMYSGAIRLFGPSQPFPFSVSKLNSISTLFVAFLWSICWICLSIQGCYTSIPYQIAHLVVMILTGTTFLLFIFIGQTGLDRFNPFKKVKSKFPSKSKKEQTERNKESYIHFIKRGLKDNTSE